MANYKRDNEAYRKGSGLLQEALRLAELEVFNLKKAIGYQDTALDLCEADKVAKDKQISQEQKRTRRARTGTKITAGLGILAAAGAYILAK